MKVNWLLLLKKILKALRYVLMKVILPFAFILVVSLVGTYFNLHSVMEIIVHTTIFIMFAVILFDHIKLYNSEKEDEKVFVLKNMSNKDKPDNLFLWSDQLQDYDGFIRKILIDIKTSNIVDDLVAIKKRLLLEFKHDLSKMQLFKAYLEAKYEDNSESDYLKSTIQLLRGVAIVISTLALTYLYNNLDILGHLNIWYGASFVFLAFMVITAALTFLGYKNKKRINLLIKITGICISEKQG